jgi:hypothetical protein
MPLPSHCFGSLQTGELFLEFKKNQEGCALVLAVSRWLHISLTRFRARIRSLEIYGGQNDTGACFLRVLGFPCWILFHLMLHTHHHPSSEVGKRDEIVAYVPSGLNLTPFQETKRNYNSPQFLNGKKCEKYTLTLEVMRNVLFISF